MNQLDPDALGAIAAIAGFGVAFFVIAVLGGILLINRRDMRGWNLPISYVWFKASGRINRKTFWLTGIIGITLVQVSYVLVIGGTTFGISRLAPINEQVLSIASLATMLPMMVFSFWASLAVNIKRCHDRDHSGWFLLVALIPLIGPIWLFIELGLRVGTPGPNRFGPGQSSTDSTTLATQAEGTEEFMGSKQKFMPNTSIPETPTSNLNDQPNNEIVAQRLGAAFLRGDDPEQTET